MHEDKKSKGGGGLLKPSPPDRMGLIPEVIALAYLPLKNNNLILLPLNNMSNSAAYYTQTSIIIDNADLHGANRVILSA